MMRITEDFSSYTINEHTINRYIERSTIKDNYDNKKRNLLKELDRKVVSRINYMKNSCGIIVTSDEVIKNGLNEIEQRLYSKYRKAAKKNIKVVLKFPIRIYPRNYTLKLINNNFEETIYLYDKDLVYVLVNNTVKTVMVYDKTKWKFKK